jgi:hypothetical protein
MKAGWRNLFPIALFFLVSCTKLAFAWGKSWSEIWSGDTQGVRGEFWQPDLVSMTRQPVQGDKAVRAPGRVCGTVQGAKVVTGAPARVTARTGRGKIRREAEEGNRHCKSCQAHRKQLLETTCT